MTIKSFNFKNESGDKKYFTQIPNMIVNHSTAYEQSLYLVMKRLAGEGGQCFASMNFLAKKMGVDKKSVSKTITKLLARKWIVEIEKTKVRGGSVRTFIIIDLWKLNMDNYESGRRITTPESGSNIPESGRQIPESGRQTDTKKNSNNNYKKETFFSVNKSNDENDAYKKAEDFKNGNKKYKPFYQGYEMRWVERDKKWWVIEHGRWLKFADKESKIEWR